MISRTHCLVYEQRWGPHHAHVWHWIAFFVCCVFTSRCSAVSWMLLLWASSRPLTVRHLCHLPAIQVECFHGAFLGSFCSDDLSEKSRIILYRVIWLLRWGALLLCVKLNKYGFQHMESESFFKITLKESFVVFNFSSWSEGKRFCWETKKLH